MGSTHGIDANQTDALPRLDQETQKPHLSRDVTDGAPEIQNQRPGHPRTSLESPSVTRPLISAHNDRLIKTVAPPSWTAMAASRYFSDWVASSNPQPTSSCTSWS